MALPNSPIKRLLALGGLVGTLFLVAVTAAESPNRKSSAGNPLRRDPQAIQAGDKLFHERCAVCHGQQAQGGMAANLVSTRAARRGNGSAAFSVIRKGIPGTDMPPHPDLSDTRIWQIVSYLRAMALPGEQPPLEGDTAAGGQVFRDAGCIDCHVVNGSGGFLGPALDSISARKTSVEIRTDVLDPNKNLAAGFETAVAVTVQGERVAGVLKNENPFTVLILTAAGEVRSLQRDQLRSFTRPARSHMPADFGTRLASEDLKNLLAFLDRQREPFVPVVRGFHGY